MQRDPDAVSSNPSDNPEFSTIVASRLSRRSILCGGIGTAAVEFLGGTGDGCPPLVDRRHPQDSRWEDRHLTPEHCDGVTRAWA